jgi:hypothetical protein
MKVPSAQAAAEAASEPCCALFFWGLEIVKFIFLKKLGFQLGPDLVNPDLIRPAHYHCMMLMQIIQKVLVFTQMSLFK